MPDTTVTPAADPAPAPTPAPSPTPVPAPALTPQIAGLSTLKGIVLYMAIFAFAGLHVYFIVKIARADPGKPPALDAAMVSAAAALAGVLGSAFAVFVGVPTKAHSTNAELGRAMEVQAQATPSRKRLTGLRRALSLEAPDTNSPSWPLTFGIWVYAVVGAAVACAFILNQSETPEQIRTLAIAFAGYVIALVYAAYGLRPQAG